MSDRKSSQDLEHCAEQAEQDGRYAQASMLWQELVQKTGMPLHARRHVFCLREAGRLDEAAAFSVTYSERWPRSPVFWRIQLEHAYHHRAWDGVDRLWEQLAIGLQGKPEHALALVRLRLRDTDIPGALHAVERAALHWPGDEQVAQRFKELSYEYGLDSKLDQPVETPNLQDPGLTPEAALLAIKQYANETGRGAAIPLLEALLARWPDYQPAVTMLLSFLWFEKRLPDIVHFCQRRFEVQSCPGAHLNRWLWSLLLLGRLDEAVKLIGEVETRGGVGNAVSILLTGMIGHGLTERSELHSVMKGLCQRHEVKGFHHAVAFEAQLRPPRRPLIEALEADQAIAASECMPASCLAILFAGYGLRMGSIPQELLDRFFAGHGIALVRLMDKSGRLYLEGLPELGGSFEATVHALRQMAKEYGASRIVTLGNSGGGMGALLYGAALSASHVLTFSPAVNLAADVMEAAADYRARAVIRKLNRLYPAKMLDARRFIEASGFSGRIDVYAGERNREDLAQVRHLAGLGNVHFHELAGVGAHDSIGEALLDGSLLEALNRMV